MANYWPEDWVVVKLNYTGKISYRVVAGWAGATLEGIIGE